ncbi:MAG: SpoIID/LytB domain-containing protein [Calditrichae bacterium]|nr:SpoIID/LytB domain-containing protein [Calditrichia bacterium]
MFLLLALAGCIPQQKASETNADIPVIRVLLDQKIAKDTLSFKGVYFMETEEARYEFGNTNKQIFIEALEDGFKIYNENRLFLFRNNDVVTFKSSATDAEFLLDQKSYTGDCIILKSDSTHLSYINHIDLETYLKGVVPAEIFTNNSSYMEAVKAQAVCARTYALNRMQKNKQKKYDVLADVRDQVYGGKSGRTANGDDAVDLTAGSILMDKQGLAVTYFHSSCGGMLEDAESVWPGNNQDYLSSRQDVVGREFADKESPYYHWQKKLNPSQLDSLFTENLKISPLTASVADTIDIPMTFKIVDRTASGRVKTLAVQYGTQRKELSGYDIRRFLGWPSGKLLPSTLFRFTQNDSLLIIDGAGNGHGVGMCQYGAMYKSQKGLQYYHILQSYFPGTYLKKVY